MLVRAVFLVTAAVKDASESGYHAHALWTQCKLTKNKPSK